MIYNLAQYLKTNFPSETIYVNQKHKVLTDSNIDDRIVVLTDSAGGLQPKTGWARARVQVYARDVDNVVSKELITELYNAIKDSNGLTLPTVTVNSIVYPAITTGQIIADQTPAQINIDDQDRPEWVFNLTIQYTEV